MVRPDGSFVFPSVAPGQYKLRVFHRARELLERPLQVSEGRPITVGQLLLPP
jgi:hypothetical protein